jgi:hypothetical protein
MLGTHIAEPTPEEMKKAMADMARSQAASAASSS